MTEQRRDVLMILRDGSREEIWAAAKELSVAATELVASLIALLRADRAETRAAAAYVLGFGRYASARTALEELLNDVNEEPSVRGHAAEALAYIQSTHSVEHLARHVGDQNAEVAYWCIFGLGQLGEVSALPVLQGLIAGVGERCHGQYSLRSEALDAIAEIRHRADAGERGAKT